MHRIKGKIMYIITIDGPAASGKSTVAGIVAKKLNIVHINSGEAYRAIAYCMLNNGVAPNDVEGVKDVLKRNSFKMVYQNDMQVVYINDEDVTAHLHTNPINDVVSQYGKIPEVIYKASDMAREISKDMSVVMDGRNLGSFCFTDAKYKFYVDCDAQIRAERRLQEMLNKGFSVNYDEMYKQVLERDALDKNREVAPLIVPRGSVLIDSSTFTPEEVANQIVDIVLDCERQKS